jgi:hypothetical protein
MVILMDVQTISVVIAAVSVIIGVINSILSSRRAEKNDQQMLETRQAQLFMQIYNRWTAKDMTTAYGLTRFQYTKEWDTPEEAFEKFIYDFNAEVYSNLQILHNFYEGLGVLVKKKLIDIELVEDLFSKRIMWHWIRNKPAFLHARKELDDPTQYDGIEYLYNIMKQRQQTPVPA